jgi:homospermidine synthase
LTENNNYANTRYARVHGYDTACPTKVFTPEGAIAEIRGFIIPHGESNTLSAYLSSGGRCPNVYYVYRPSAPALRSLARLRLAAAAGSRLRTMPVLDQRSLDVAANGFDSIGAYIQTESGAGWWCGTVLSIQDVRGYGVRHAGPTECQVAISYLAAARWALRHRRRGLCNPEHLDSARVLEWCLPYLGRFVSQPA